MDTINRLQLKALLLDTVTVLKFGTSLAPNSKAVKKQLCEQLGQKANISNSQLLNGIGLVYKDNGLESDYWRIIDKFKAEKYL